jgi:hypothetical protein
MRPLYICRTAPLDWCLAEAVPEDDDMRQLDAGGLVQLVEKSVDRLKARRPDQVANFTFKSRDFRDLLNQDPAPPQRTRPISARTSQRCGRAASSRWS